MKKADHTEEKQPNSWEENPSLFITLTGNFNDSPEFVQRELSLRYQALFEHNNDVVALISPERKILAVNQRTLELFGYTAAELVGQDVTILVNDEEVGDAKQKHTQLIKGQQIPIYERTVRRKDGSTMIIEINIIPVRDSQENLIYYQSIGRDITERKRTEDLLKEYENRYRALFEQSNDGVFTNDLDGNIKSLNPHAAEMLGYEVEELIGQPFRLITAPDEYPDAQYKLAQLMKGKAIPTYERNLLKKSGRSVPVEVNLTLILDTNRKPIGTQSIVRDISERKVAENIIQESVNRYRALFEQGGDAIFIIDKDGTISDANHQAVHLFGYTYWELLGKRPEEMVPLSEKQESSDKLKMAMIGMRPPVYERFLQRKDGSIFPAEINLSPVQGSDGSILYVQSIVRDVSQQKATERALKESGHRYQTLFTQSIEAIVITDLEGYLLEANPSAAQMLGYEVKEMKGMHFRMLITPSERTETSNTISKLLAGEVLPAYERLARRKDGTEFPVEIRATLVRDTDGNPLYIQSSANDITERKNIERQLYHLATHDPLTGVPNRALFFNRLDRALERARRTQFKVAVLFIDLDGFKEVNDTYGHAVGDQLLEAIARRLEACFRKNDTLARMGGDEFTLIFENIQNLEQAIVLSERVLSSLENPFFLSGFQIKISGSLGLSIFPDDAVDEEVLVNRADKAMYAVKRGGKQGLGVYQYMDDIKDL